MAIEKEHDMTDTMRLAVPTNGEGGLEGERSEHFGHCDCFTLVDIEDGKVKSVSILQNPAHEEGGCLRPVGLLSEAGVNAIVAGGMGGRPLAGFQDAGIEVYFENRTPGIAEIIALILGEGLPVMSLENACHH